MAMAQWPRSPFSCVRVRGGYRRQDGIVLALSLVSRYLKLLPMWRHFNSSLLASGRIVSSYVKRRREVLQSSAFSPTQGTMFPRLFHQSSPGLCSRIISSESTDRFWQRSPLSPSGESPSLPVTSKVVGTLVSPVGRALTSSRIETRRFSNGYLSSCSSFSTSECVESIVVHVCGYQESLPAISLKLNTAGAERPDLTSRLG